MEYCYKVCLRLDIELFLRYEHRLDAPAHAARQWAKLLAKVFVATITDQRVQRGSFLLCLGGDASIKRNFLTKLLQATGRRALRCFTFVPTAQHLSSYLLLE